MRTDTPAVGDIKTGKELWNQKFAEAKEGYYSTNAPIVANAF
jgi:hypothetical protein